MKLFLKKQRFIYLLIMSSILILLLQSTKIINSIHGNGVEKLKVDITLMEKDVAYCSVDEITPYKDLFESLYIFGWVFCETYESNSNKEMAVILSNQSSAFIYKSDQMLARPDIATKLGETYHIHGDNNGFGVSFSTLLVPNGLYDVYLYCKENDENYGIVFTGYQVLKNANGLSIQDWKSNIIKTAFNVNATDTVCAIDSVEILTDDSLKIVGWAFVPETESSKQDIYLRLTYPNGLIETYTTQSISRPDVGSAYNNKEYSNSGFWAVIPNEGLVDGDYTIEVIVDVGDWAHISNTPSKVFINI